MTLYLLFTKKILTKTFARRPDLETVLGIFLHHFRCFKNLVSTINCTEVFIKTSKNIELQNVRWIEYKHLNTTKLLVFARPNICYIYFRGFDGRISDKALIIESVTLDQIMVRIL